MRCQDAVVQAYERAVLFRRFSGENISCGTCNKACLEGIGQSPFVNKSASGCVDENSPGFMLTRNWVFTIFSFSGVRGQCSDT